MARLLVAERRREAAELAATIAASTEGTEGLGRKKRTLLDRQQPLRLLEALSASGLRAIRYAQEVEGLAPLVANDFSNTAVELIRKNVAR